MEQLQNQTPWPQSEAQLYGEPEQSLDQLPKISEGDVGNGLDGNVQTIDLMKKIARDQFSEPLIRQLALNILAQYNVPSHHFVDEAYAIGDYVKKKVRYVRDPDTVEYLQSPLDLVKKIQNNTAQGDCDDMALLVATLLLSIGHRPAFRAVRYDSRFGNYNHIYVVDRDKNPYGQDQRIVLDAILKNQPIGSEVNHLNGDDYSIE